MRARRKGVILIGRTAIVLAVMLSCPRPGTAGIRWVPGEYPTIQDAIDVSAAGDTVLVSPGTYEGDGNRDLRIRGSIVVRSEKGPEVTRIDAGGTYHHGFIVLAGAQDSPRIEGFEITNGHEAGAGIWVVSSSPVITGCILTRNFAGDAPGSCGGGILCEGESRVSIRGCEVTENAGSGICGTESSFTLIENCRIERNQNGIFLRDGASMRIAGCWIAENFFGGGGGGINSESIGELEVEDCVIVLNQSLLSGGGIDVAPYTGGVLRIVGSTIAGNEANAAGGISSTAQDFRLERSILYWNWGPCPGERSELFVSGASNQVVCSAIDSSYIRCYGSARIEYVGEQVFTDPLFCKHHECWGPPEEADHRLRADSPCLPESSPCGMRIGALEVGCDPVATKVTTWGKVRALFR